MSQTFTTDKTAETAVSLDTSEDATRSEHANHALLDAEAERKLVRKLDLYLIPVIMVVFFFSFLDRINIGNAQVGGLSASLHLQGSQFNVAVSIFYVTYIVFEIPLTIALKLVGPSKLIPGMMIAWSLVTTFSGFEHSYGALVACRLLLGACESALFPSLHLYCAMFWKRQEIAKRAGMIMVTLAVAGAFGGLFAYGLLHMNGVAGYAGWQWIFFIQGGISFLVGVISIWLFPDSPETAYFLDAKERDLARQRLVDHGNYEAFDFAQVQAVLSNPLYWLSGLINLCANIYNYSVTTFLPTIINNLGFDTLQTQYLTIPVYVVGGVGFFAAAYWSDRTQRRSDFMLAFGLVTLTGYAVLLGSRTPTVLYFACYLVLFGNFVFPGLNLIWINGNTAPHYKRATAIALNQTIGNIGGIIAGQIYLTREKPWFVTGHAVSLTGCALAWCGVWLLRWLFARENARRDKLVQEGATDTGTGDRSIYFRYQL